MKIFYKILNTLNRSRSAYKRFTLSMVFVLLAALFFSIYVISDDEAIFFSSSNLVYVRIACLMLMLAVAVTFLTIFKEALISSSKNKEELKRGKYIELISLVLTMILIYEIYSKLFQPEKFMAYDTKYIFFGVMLFFIVVCSFIGRIFNHRNFVFYFFKVIEALFISLAFSTVLFLGFMAIYFLVNKLFDVNIADKVYMITFIIIYLPFNVGILLSYFPKREIDLGNHKTSKTFEVLITYIVIPIFTIYAFILYVYFSKIIIQRQLPKGIITDLVLWFSMLSVFLLFISSVLKDNKVVEKFRNFFPIIMIPIILVMFYAIFIRISQYGLTEKRYFVIMGGIYGLISMLYYIFYRDNSNITILVVLSALVFLSSIGPISAYSLSTSSQDRRLAAILNSNEMLDGTQIKAKKNVSLEDKIEIKEIVEYLSVDHRSWESKYLPKDFEFSNENFEEVFGFNIEDRALFSASNEYNFKFDRPIDISGYDKMMRFDSLAIENSSIGNYFVDTEDGQYTIGYKDGKSKIDITSFTAKEIFDKMIALRESKDIVDVDDLAIEGSSHNIKYKIVFVSVGYYGSEKDISNYYIEFYLLAANID